MSVGRLVLIVLATWALAMIVPDLTRLFHPLGSFGFLADNDGVVYDVVGPFEEEARSPAYVAGLRVGDRLDLTQMRCFPYDASQCRNALGVFGGIQFVLPGETVELHLAAASGEPRTISLTAIERETNGFVRFILLCDQLAGIAVILAAAWFVWTRPGLMSWSFFLFAMWFNPGQAYVFYATLREWPILLLAQYVAAACAEGAAYGGLLLFAARVPTGAASPEWAGFERIVPALATAFSLGLLATYANLAGYPTESITENVLLGGFVFDLAALAILLARRRNQTPANYQRMRWVIWGCLIGMPAFIIAELAQDTTVLNTRWGDFTPSEDVVGLLYLVQGLLFLFVFEAIRRPRVVNVSIPLRRVTLLGFLLTFPAMFLHHQADHIREMVGLPDWAWLVAAAVILFVISRLHELGVEITERLLNAKLDKAEERIAASILAAKEPDEIDRLLADEPYRVLKLSSAATFRKTGAEFLRHGDGPGWDRSAARRLEADGRLLKPLSKGEPFPISEAAEKEVHFPADLARPVLAVPATNHVRCFALGLYGPHEAGTDLDEHERALLARLGKIAADVYAELDAIALRSKISELESALSAGKAKHRSAVD
ncbi:MAG: hypothetical protein U1E46_12245 [Hyphomicrobiales bacterium]